MQPRKKPLIYATAQQPLEKPVTAVTRQDSVAMIDINPLLADKIFCGVGMDSEANISLQKASQTEIMVPRQIMKRDSRILQSLKSAEKAEMPLGDHRVPFVPEVKNIANQNKRFGLPLNFLQKRKEFPVFGCFF
jgi:hypothetical protein